MRRLRLILQRFRSFRFRKVCFPLHLLKIKIRSTKDRSFRAPGSSRGHHQGSMAEDFHKKKRSSSTAAVNDRLLLACNPCTGSTSTAGMVVENYKFQIPGSSLKRPPKKSEGENWEKERSWNIVTQVGGEFVTKKVILKKKCKNKLIPGRKSCDRECEEAAHDPFEVSSRYRLSTSSSAAEFPCGGEHQMYSWDKEMSFTSWDDRFPDQEEYYARQAHSCLDDLHRLEASTKDVFVDRRLCNDSRSSSFNSMENFIKSVENAGDNSKHFPSPDSRSEAQQDISLKKFSSCKGVAVMKSSVDPYRDYRDSMLEMSAANHLQEASELEELLDCYLDLNPAEFHDIILEAFTDLLLIVRQRFS